MVNHFPQFLSEWEHGLRLLDPAENLKEKTNAVGYQYSAYSRWEVLYIYSLELLMISQTMSANFYLSFLNVCWFPVWHWTTLPEKLRFGLLSSIKPVSYNLGWVGSDALAFRFRVWELMTKPLMFSVRHFHCDVISLPNLWQLWKNLKVTSSHSTESPRNRPRKALYITNECFTIDLNRRIQHRINPVGCHWPLAAKQDQQSRASRTVFECRSNTDYSSFSSVLVSTNPHENLEPFATSCYSFFTR